MRRWLGKGWRLRRDGARQKNPSGDGKGAAWPPGLPVPVQAAGTAQQEQQHRQGWGWGLLQASLKEGAELESPVPLTW